MNLRDVLKEACAPADARVMDIGSLTSAAAATSGVDLSSKVSTRVARIALDEQKREGDAAVALLEGAAEIAKTAAQRGGVDVQA